MLIMQCKDELDGSIRIGELINELKATDMASTLNELFPKGLWQGSDLFDVPGMFAMDERKEVFCQIPLATECSDKRFKLFNSHAGQVFFHAGQYITNYSSGAVGRRN